MRLSDLHAQEFLNLTLNGTTQPADVSPGEPKLNLTVSEAVVPGLTPQDISFGAYANESFLNDAKVIFDTGGDGIAPANVDGFVITNQLDVVFLYGDPDAASVPIDVDASVACQVASIGCGVAPNVNGPTTQDAANTTAWGETYYRRFFDHYLNIASWAGSPAGLHLAMFATGTAGETQTDPGLGVYTNRPVTPLAPEWTAEPRVQLGVTPFDISNPAGNAWRATLNSEVRFPNSSIATIASVGLYDAATNGNLVAMSDVDPDAISSDGNDVVFAAGSIWFEVNTGA